MLFIALFGLQPKKQTTNNPSLEFSHMKNLPVLFLALFFVSCAPRDIVNLEDLGSKPRFARQLLIPDAEWQSLKQGIEKLPLIEKPFPGVPSIQLFDIPGLGGILEYNCVTSSASSGGCGKRVCYPKLNKNSTGGVTFGNCKCKGEPCVDLTPTKKTGCGLIAVRMGDKFILQCKSTTCQRCEFVRIGGSAILQCRCGLVD